MNSLIKKYISYWNKRFIINKENIEDVHKPIDSLNLDSIFSVIFIRVVANDLTFRFSEKKYQIVSHRSLLIL
jgi:hypothetical protein